jgi:D-hydroxyproline dehydrogenase subunit alpha
VKGEASQRVLVIGAGPAGMAAANAVRDSGWEPIVVDENPHPGGQIWRGAASPDLDEHRKSVMGAYERTGGLRYAASHWLMEPRAGLHVIATPDGVVQIESEKVILCTGARERFLPFPGWTLPGVHGAGALQALVKMGLAVRGRRIVVAGTGPLLLAVASLLRAHGAEIACIAEQADKTRLLPVAMGLLRSPAKLRQAIALRRSLKGVPILFGTWPSKAEGTNRLNAITLRSQSGSRTIPCDMLACGFHLVPNTEVARALGCAVVNDAVVVDDHLATTRPGVYTAGETLGIGGVECAVVEGSIAGYEACGNSTSARALAGHRRRARRFADTLNRAFYLRAELRSLCESDTEICRCEDVPHGDLARFTDWRSAKLNTRCGMGACQGRVCGPINQFLFGWEPVAHRPPVFSASIQTLADGFSNMNITTHTNNKKETP